MDVLTSWDGGLTLLAPVAAISLALLTRRIVASLVVGILVAAVVAAHGAILPAAQGVASYLGEAVWSWDNFRITLFTLLVSASVAVMGASGATETLVGSISRMARGPRGAQVAAWLSGLVVFFDDYANCLIVGGSMGPVFDRWGVSRAKLSYVVDSTSAPVASLALIGTWIGFEVGLLDQALEAAGRPAGQGYALFLDGLSYRFYPIFAFLMVGLVAMMGRDFGPMLAEERAARRTAAVVEPVREPRSLVVAILPILALVVGTAAVLLWGGISALPVPLAQARAFQILEGADSYGAMVVGGGASLLVAVAVAVLTRALSAPGAAKAMLTGAHSVASALAVLYCAWTLGNAISATSAQTFLVGLLSDQLDPVWLPTASFLLACGVSFATGTSFGTMTILIPLVVPLGVAMDGGDGTVLAMTASSVLAGACFGDHLSPVSDTTVLSAAGSGVDVVTHTRTQAPYGLVAGAVALLVGTIPASMGVPSLLLIGAGTGVMAVVLWTVGRPSHDSEASAA